MTDAIRPAAPDAPRQDAQNTVAGATTLKRNQLSMLEVLTQSVANAAPSAAMALLPLLVFADAGNGTWLSFLIAIGVVLCVGWCASQFARRLTSAGSFYVWVARGLGPLGGFLAGWGLLLGEIALAIETTIGTAILGNNFLAYFGVPDPNPWAYGTLIVLGIVVPTAIAIRGMELSARTSLILEGASISIILFLCVAIWVHRGSVVSTPQITLQGVTPGGLLVGVVLSIFAFVGFESAGSLGMEARNPYRAIGRAIMLSCAVVGVFYLIVSYSQVFGFQGTQPGFEHATVPMPQLARMIGMRPLGPIIALGITASVFACTLACLNAAGRMAFAMAHDGLGIPALQRTHAKWRTPHVALLTVGAFSLVFSFVCNLVRINFLDLAAWVGSVSAFGFMLAYVLICIAAPVWLARQGLPWVRFAIVGGIGAIVMALVFWSSWLPQVIPGRLFHRLTGVAAWLPYIFFAWVLIGLVSYLAYRRSNPERAKQIGAHFESNT